MTQLKVLFLSITAIILFFCSNVYSQNDAIKIVGKLLDEETKEPISNVTVFLSFTSYHTQTNMFGEFSIYGVVPGAYSLICVAKGYQKVSLRVDVNGKANLKANIVLKKMTSLNKNDISQVSTFIERHKFVEKFKKEFLGGSIRTYKCEIVNENDITFTHNGIQLFAHSDTPIIIINKSLGYKLTVFLNKFEWEWFSDYGKFSIDMYFDELKPADSFEAVRFAANRLEAYKGSFRHFLRACAIRKVYKEGFVAFLANYVPQELGEYEEFKDQVEDERSSNVMRLIDAIIIENSENEFTIELEGYLEVVYKGRKEEANYTEYKERIFGTSELYDFQDSWVYFPGGKYTFTSRGIGLESEKYSKQLFGYWNWKRVSDLLPNEYEPIEVLE
ncbi:MAG: TonB-dependent receptor plug [Ignavibacteria bacterium]|nr:MAG: TonB-dependent receptor plug [Ignavibacteria bacterium]KAF0161189.1 MAG: TonB-dependent receptor plug [Ignavibacteria bacterium]